MKNGSALPSSQEFLTQERLCSLDFSNDEIIKLIRFQNSIKLSHFSDIWKMSNIIPVHKKNDKQLIQNYRPISLLPIFGKIFEKVVFNRIYNFLLNKRLLNPNQLGFRPSDSYINQLLAITHEIFEPFDCNPSLEVRSVFLDIPNHSTRFGFKSISHRYSWQTL